MESRNNSLGTFGRYPRVIFIVGTGRSGSTILDLFLGQHPMIQSAGELCNVAKSGWIGGEFCSCGDRVSACRFWNDVRKRWEELTGTTPEEYERLRTLVEQRRSTLWKLLRDDRLENLVLSEKGPGEFLAYAQWTVALYRAITEVNGKKIIVDSSKNPARGLALAMMDQRMDLIDLDLIQLVRDVRGFAWSQRKSFRRDERAGVARDLAPRPVWKSALVWLFINSISEKVLARHEPSRTLLLRYEDFAGDTLQEALKIASFLNISPEPWLDVLAAKRPLENSHVVAGNRVRMQRQITIRPDTEWQSRLTGFEKALCWFLAGWKAHRYGYAWRSPIETLDASGSHNLAGPHYIRSRQPLADKVASLGKNEG